jgi:hypothetical protein
VRGPSVWLRGGLIAAFAVALAAGTVDADPDAAAARVSSTGGAAAVSDSLGGDAIVRADNLGPGGSTTGTVTISNAGDATGAFTLAKSGMTDVPGSGDGRLSTRLQLNVEEVGSGRQVYAGALRDLAERSLGYLGAGESRAYRFTVAFPHGAGDNAFAGAQTTVAFDWTAATGEPPAGPEPTGQTGAPAPEPPRPVPPPPADTRSPHVRIRSAPQRWSPRAVPITITCDERCFLVGMSRGAKPKPRERLLAGVATTQRVRVSREDAKVLYDRVRRRGRGTLALALTVRDRAGNRTTMGFTIRVVR